MNTSTIAPRGEAVVAAGMLRSLKALEGYRIAATNGDVGKVHDFFFDDEFWTIRYVVVDTGHWLPGRKVLLTPGVLLDPDWRARSFSVAMTRDQIKSSPDIDTDQPVSRQREMELHAHYGWPYYWVGLDGIVPTVPVTPVVIPQSEKKPGDPHLRSVREMIGYGIEATDGDIGRVDDFIVDDQTWVVRYLVVATHKWLPGRKVLIAPQWLVGPISWSAQKVSIMMSRASIKNSPRFDPRAAVNREYEERLYDFYGRPTYWSSPHES